MSSKEVSQRDVELCQQGNRAALDRVLRAHSSAMEATICRLYGWGPDGEDVMQRAMVAAVKAFPSFRGDSAVRTWLIGITVNTVRDAWRMRARRRAAEVPSDERVLQVFSDGAVTPEQMAHSRALVRRAEVQLAELSDTLRESYVLHVILGHTLKETAAILQVPLLTVKSRVARARQKVNEALAQDRHFRGERAASSAPHLAAVAAGGNEGADGY